MFSGVEKGAGRVTLEDARRIRSGAGNDGIYIGSGERSKGAIGFSSLNLCDSITGCGGRSHPLYSEEALIGYGSVCL